MAAPSIQVTKGNLITGPATTFALDGIDLGGTLGGVQIEKKQKLVGVMVDQIPGDVAEAVESEEYTISTELAEVTLQNLQYAWGLDAAPVTDVGAGTQTLSLGIQQKVVEHALVLGGPAPNGKQRTFTSARVVNMVTGKQELDRKKQYGFPVSFTILPELTATGKEYGQVVDQ